MKKLVVWHNVDKNTYYYRIVRGLFYERYNYEVGEINNYGHRIVLVIPLEDIKKSINFNKCNIFLKRI